MQTGAAIIRHAQCECGAVQFAVSGDPVHVHACTCTLCQRSSGSVMSHTVWFPAAAVTITGNYTTRHHRGPDHPDHFRGFCTVCGSGHFFYSGDPVPDKIAMAVGSFADPGFPPPAFVLYWDNRPAWLGAPSNVKLYPGDDT